MIIVEGGTFGVGFATCAFAADVNLLCVAAVVFIILTVTCGTSHFERGVRYRKLERTVLGGRIAFGTVGMAAGFMGVFCMSAVDLNFWQAAAL